MFAASPPRAPFSTAVAFVLLASVAVVSSGEAQEGTPPPSPPPADTTMIAPAPIATPAPVATAPVPAMPGLSAPLSAELDSTLALPLLVEPRPREEINADLGAMVQLKAQAEFLVSQYKAREARKKSQAEIKKTEVSSAKIRIDLAKKEKRAIQQKDLESTKKRLESQQKFLERMRDLLAAEGETQKATADYAQARAEECRAELRLYDLGDLTSPVVRMSAAARGAQARVIDALKGRADKAGRLADNEKTQADRRKAVLDAYAEMIK
ncbi:MAG: hypothetical protein ABI960_00535 [Candidatus Eisenbacteria bacterium]